MPVITGRHPVIIELCTALGLDANRVRSLNIDMSVDSVLDITVTQFADSNQLERFTGVLIERGCTGASWRRVEDEEGEATDG